MKKVQVNLREIEMPQNEEQMNQYQGQGVLLMYVTSKDGNFVSFVSCIEPDEDEVREDCFKYMKSEWEDNQDEYDSYTLYYTGMKDIKIKDYDSCGFDEECSDTWRLIAGALEVYAGVENCDYDTEDESSYININYPNGERIVVEYNAEDAYYEVDTISDEEFDSMMND
ncbi:MAG: hypothetical protein IJ213_04180 [Bacteroidales bacterium]|nr:hypothetical protein [Bacteroidales bacterium]